jgi:hypothetical protein
MYSDLNFRNFQNIAALFFAIAVLIPARFAYAQGGTSANKPEPDTLIFTNGEKLIGHLVRSNDGSVTFHSDMAGDVKVEWSKIQELHSAQQFAVVEKNVKLRKGETGADIPQGTLSIADQKIGVKNIAAGTTQTIPVASVEYLIDEATFQKTVLHRAGPFEEWKGALTAGAALVLATQKSRTYTGNISLIRSVPPEDWLDPRNRTTVNFSGAYGILIQPNTPKLKTEIYHADAEHDEYFTPRVYAFGQVAFDHNFSQGLRLEQIYGGGIGWSIIKNANEEFDIKGSLSYVEQQFQAAAASQNLLGSTFAESYHRKLPRKMLLTEELSITPAWNNTNAYSATGNSSFTMPLYKRFNFTVGSIDTFLNNPPPGFRKNSFQLTTGLTYALGKENGTP